MKQTAEDQEVRTMGDRGHDQGGFKGSYVGGRTMGWRRAGSVRVRRRQQRVWWKRDKIQRRSLARRQSILDMKPCGSAPETKSSGNRQFASRVLVSFDLFWASPPPILAELFTQISPSMPASDFPTFPHIFACGSACISGEASCRFTDVIKYQTPARFQWGNW